MTLSFSTKFTDKTPTYFICKLWKGLYGRGLSFKHMYPYMEEHFQKFQKSWNVPSEYYNSKIHTIRQDVKKRWKVGMKIHFVINNRTKNRFQFAPVLEVKKIQEIEIKYVESKHYKINIGVFVDGQMIGNAFGNDEIESYDNTLLTLALNDGFKDVQSFFDWFKEDFTGRLIHWTDLSY